MSESQPTSAEKDALANVPLRVNREHEDAPWGCSCGAKFGDGIDRRWHLMNETVKATLAHVLPPAGPSDHDNNCPCHLDGFPCMAPEATRPIPPGEGQES